MGAHLKRGTKLLQVQIHIHPLGENTPQGLLLNHDKLHAKDILEFPHRQSPPHHHRHIVHIPKSLIIVFFESLDQDDEH